MLVWGGQDPSSAFQDAQSLPVTTDALVSAPGRKSERPLPSHPPPDTHPTAHTEHGCLLSGPSPKCPIQTGPWEALAFHFPHLGNVPSPLLASWRGMQLCLCSAPWTSVISGGQLWPLSRPDMCLALRMAIPPQTLHLPSGSALAPPSVHGSQLTFSLLGPSSFHGPAVPPS